MAVILQLDKKIYDTIFSYGIINGIDISKYVLKPLKNKKILETEYLLATKANKNILLQSIKNSKDKKNLVEFDI